MIKKLPQSIAKKIKKSKKWLMTGQLLRDDQIKGQRRHINVSSIFDLGCSFLNIVSIHPSIRLSVHPSIHASTHPFIHLCIHPSDHSSIRAFIHSFIHSVIHPTMHTSIHQSIYPSVNEVKRSCFG